jgi:hypothetical protein
MKDQTGFPTQGEAIKFAYAASGVLPRKKAESNDGFDETQKKTLQKKLDRLAKEEGNLLDNMQEAGQMLSNLLAEYLPHPDIMGCIGDVLNDLFDQYNALIRYEGTYLNKADSLRYFISIKGVPQIILRLHRYLTRYGLFNVKRTTPDDDFWYLPSLDGEGKVIYPISKVLDWAYTLCECSQTQFHYPGKQADSDNNRLNQNLSNACNWKQGVTLPSLPALITNLKESFQAMDDVGYTVPVNTQVSIQVALVIARITTYIAQQIVKSYGVDYLRDVCDQFRMYSKWLKEDVFEFYSQAAPVIKEAEDSRATEEERWNAWHKVCDHHWSFLLDKVRGVGDDCQKLLIKTEGAPIREPMKDALAHKYGDFAARMTFDQYDRHQSFPSPPERFVRMLGKGLHLKKSPDTDWGQIEQYESDLQSSEVQDSLCWMVPWLKAAYHYRNSEYETAFEHYERAFKMAKYSAGKHQYDLINQFVEVAAKNNNIRAFKKGALWADYLGVPIRWLRDKEPTEENLDVAFYILSKADYSHYL